ncbi:MAG: P27 family phage terminase small subunit [Candidatus Hodarchaeales archaeon]
MHGGLKPKPTKLKVLEGNRGHRRIPKNPEPAAVLPDPPEWMDEVAKNKWRELAKALYQLGLLTEVDVGALEALCQLYAKWRRVTENKQSGTHAEVTLARELRMWYAEFGMTPSSRSRIDVEKIDDKSNEWREFIQEV